MSTYILTYLKNTNTLTHNTEIRTLTNLPLLKESFPKLNVSGSSFIRVVAYFDTTVQGDPVAGYPIVHLQVDDEHQREENEEGA